MSCLSGMHGALLALTELFYAGALICAVIPVSASGADLQRLLQDGRVPGLSIAVIRNREIADISTAGVRNASTAAAVDADTILEAASLSKPIFAYAVLRLVDAGVLSLDTRLADHAPDYLPDDPRAAGITVRDVLRHTTGLPNWRNNEYRLKTYFPPGARFSYSGEGFVWLQRAVEAVSGEPLDALARRLVFEPLQMRRSSYVWQPEFDANHADPHDAALTPGTKGKPAAANPASSLHTTAADYARFLQAVLSGTGLQPATARLWLAPQVRLRRPCRQCLSDSLPEADQRVAWGLGWRLEPESGTFFHWGDNGRFKAFVIGSMAERSAVVAFANGENGMAIMPDLIHQLMPGDHPVFGWLNYPRVPDRR
jgi:CubicO group peptidase (beta-lactamase class C family)